MLLAFTLSEANHESCATFLTYRSVDETLKCGHLNEPYSPVVLFTMLSKVAPTFESVDGFLMCAQYH